MRLFDDIPRTSTDLMKESASAFEYYNQSARPFVAAMRGVLESWYSMFPNGDHKAELRARFRDSDNAQHYGAIFELFIHALLKGMGLEVEIHPDIPGSTRHPDFLAKRNGESLFYVEATIADLSDHAEKRERGLTRLREAIDKVPSPQLYLDGEVRQSGDQDVTFRPFIKAVSRWVQSIDAAQMEIGVIPTFTWKRDGWDLELTPRMKPPARRGQGGRTRGAVMNPIFLVEISNRIANAVKTKAGLYGQLDLPLIVAVNVMDGTLHDEHIMEGLFGSETTTYQVSDQGIEFVATGRAPDGAFYGSRGLQNSRVSAAMICDRMSPGDVHSRRTVLVHHPKARRPLLPDLWPLPQLIPNRERKIMDPRPGKTAGEILGMPVPWPPTSE